MTMADMVVVTQRRPGRGCSRGWRQRPAADPGGHLHVRASTASSPSRGPSRALAALQVAVNRPTRMHTATV